MLNMCPDIVPTATLDILFVDSRQNYQNMFKRSTICVAAAVMLSATVATYAQQQHFTDPDFNKNNRGNTTCNGDGCNKDCVGVSATLAGGCAGEDISTASPLLFAPVSVITPVLICNHLNRHNHSACHGRGANARNTKLIFTGIFLDSGC